MEKGCVSFLSDTNIRQRIYMLIIFEKDIVEFLLLPNQAI